MPKTILKLLAAGAIGCASIIGGYAALAALGGRLPPGTSNMALIVAILVPIPIGLFVALAIYRILDRIWPSQSAAKQ